jgi:tRNA(Ile)-lysidine synthase
LDREDTGLATLRHWRDPLLQALATAADALCLSGRRVLVAASAGLDSTVLAHLLARHAESLGIEVCLGHVHHGLRDAEADADAGFVEALAGQLGVPFGSRHIDARAGQGNGSSRDRLTLQESARDLRRVALGEIASQLSCDTIATAHHANDQAETVLMRLLRGTGPDGLAGIPASSPHDRVVRPLLQVPRAALEHFAEQHEITWREDSSNASDQYLRNRIRRHWLPALTEEFNPKLLRALGDLAEAQRRDGEWIEEQVASEARARFSMEGSWLQIDTRDWERLPEALARRLAREALVRCGAGRHVTRRHLERMLSFLRSGRARSAIELPGNLLLRCENGAFRLGPGSLGAKSDPPGAC